MHNALLQQRFHSAAPSYGSSLIWQHPHTAAPQYGSAGNKQQMCLTPVSNQVASKSMDQPPTPKGGLPLTTNNISQTRGHKEETTSPHQWGRQDGPWSHLPGPGGGPARQGCSWL